MSEMTKEELKKRTKQGEYCGTCHRQSVGANYRAALRARSPRDFGNKIGVVLEETDESAYWMELIVEGKIMPENRVSSPLREANGLTAIFAATHKTIKANARRKNSNPKS